MKLGLERMRDACAAFGHPERSFRAVHIAGTNGKGSVSAMTASMLRANGARTGLFTSPHLFRYAERMVVDGVAFDDERLGAVLDDVLRFSPELSFFEVTTLAAFILFRDAKVDVAVLEVGLGGRLDSTNVIPPPVVAAITSIGIDHAEYLGSTHEQIAREKAGICKPRSPVLLGRMDPEHGDAIERAIVEVATNAGSIVSTRASRDAERAAQPPDASLVDVIERMKMRGTYQIDNAELAWSIGESLGIDRVARARGILSTRWPGRYETIESEDGVYLLDCAHNPDGCRALCTSLAESGVHTNNGPVRLGDVPFALVFGALADKDWRAMLDVLAPAFSARVYAPVVVARQVHRKSAWPEQLADTVPGEPAKDIESAVRMARLTAGPRGVVVVAGSIFLVAAVRARLLGAATDPPVPL